MARAIVVGAGPGGLTAAMLLARAGLDVTVYERRPDVGGHTSMFEAEGFRFDYGPTFFLYPKVLEEIFRAVGRDLHTETDLMRIDPQYQLVFGEGGRLLATTDPAEMARRTAELSPADEGAFERWRSLNERKLRALEPVLQRPFLSRAALLRPNMLKVLPHLHATRSLYDELKRFFTDPRLLLTFSFQAKYLGMSPFDCPSIFSILAFLEYGFGVYHPRGGCGALSARMGEIAEELGAEFRLGEPVEQITFDGRRATGVRTASGEHRADAVVMNADFARGMLELVPPEARRHWGDDRIRGSRFSCSCFMIYLGIEGRYDDLQHHNIYFSADYERNLADVNDRHVLAEDPSLYVQNVCVSDPDMAPNGMSTLYVLVPVTHQHPNVDWERDRKPYRDLIMAQLPKLGIEGLGDRIRYERVYTPDDWADEQYCHKGATFNLAHTFGQMLNRRPHNRFEDAERLYLVGGGTHPGTGLPVIYEGARIASRLLLDDLGRPTDWLQPRAG